MSVVGRCGICESAPADHRCPRCGTLVCPTHCDGEAGLCTGCAAEVDRSGTGA